MGHPQPQDVASNALRIIRQPRQAAILLKNPLRMEIVRRMQTPSSSTILADELGEGRQVVNYHIQQLYKAGFLHKARKRKRGGFTEQLYKAAAPAWIVSPEAMGALAPSPAALQDQFSWATLIRAAGQIIHDLGILRPRADRAGQTLPTFSLETEVRFASAADRDAFTAALASAVAHLAARYQAPEGTENSRLFRFVLGAYPAITKTEEEA